MFTEIEALEQRIRRSAEKDNENLKLITTIEVRLQLPPCRSAHAASRPRLAARTTTPST